jgi:hypothetical protein
MEGEEVGKEGHGARYCRRWGGKIGIGVGRFRWPLALVFGGVLFVWLAAHSRPLYTTPMCIVYDNPAYKAGRR